MKPIGVAFSGSGFLFPAHVGALSAIVDAGYRPHRYAGTSGGSIVAALAASGMSVAEMKTMTLSRDWSDMLSFNPFRFMTSLGFDSGDKLQAFIADKTGGKTFADLVADLIVVASDMADGGTFVFDRDRTPTVSLAQACRASAAIPFIYTGVQIGNAWLVDGGVRDNMPADLLPDDGEIRIGIDLDSKLGPLPSRLTAWAMLPRLLRALMGSSEDAHEAAAIRSGARLVVVDTSYASSLDRNIDISTRQRLFDDGYRETAAVLARLA